MLSELRWPALADLMPYLQMAGALVLALPTAWNRERHSRIMGLRTFPLVALGACAYVLVAETFIGIDEPNARARILQGLLSGIGFIGGGAILKNDDTVRGTATAAAIWVTGALGAAVGFGYWNLAIALSVLNFAVIWGLGALKSEVDRCEIDD